MFSMLIFGCSKKQTKYTLNAEDYFPKGKIFLKYSGGFENGGFTYEYKEFKDSKILIKVTSTGGEIARVYEVNEDMIKNVYSCEGYEENTNYFEVKDNSSQIEFKTPIQKGAKWSDDSGTDYEITDIDLKIKVPAGEYNTVEVTSKSETLEVKTYYAEGIGMVKQIINSDGVTVISSELLSIDNIIK